MAVDKRLLPLTIFPRRRSFTTSNPRDRQIFNDNQMTLEFAAFCSKQAELRRVIINVAHRLCDVLNSLSRCSTSVCCATCLFCLSRCIWRIWRELARNLRRPTIMLLIRHPGSDCKNFILTLGRSINVLTLLCLHHPNLMINIIICYIYT